MANQNFINYLLFGTGNPFIYKIPKGSIQTHSHVSFSNPDFNQFVLIEFRYGIDSLDPLHALEDKLHLALDHTGIGYHDGHEIAKDDSHGRLFLYGTNAEAVYKLIEPILFTVDWMDGAEVFLRFGDTSDKEAKEIDFVLQRV